MSDRLDEILSQMRDLKSEGSKTYILLEKHITLSEERERLNSALRKDMWGEAGKNEGIKSDVKTLKDKEGARGWWHRAIAGTTVGLLGERLLHYFKP